MFNAAPLAFVQNRGQFSDPDVRYLFQGSGANVLFTETGTVFQLFQQPGPDESAGVYALVFGTSFLGANQVNPTGATPLPSRMNYLLGSDPADWLTNLETFSSVAYSNLYTGIDLYASGSRSALKYVFDVAPGADYNQIAIRYEGIQKLTLDASGALHVQTALGNLVDAAPFIYQDIGGARTPVLGAYRIIDQYTYGFEILGAYDTTQTLVIDPDLKWSTFLGGASDDVGLAIALDPSGNAYVTGYTASSNFPTTPGAYDRTYNIDNPPFPYDVFITKFDGTTGTPLYSTFFGGKGNDWGRAIAVDSSGSAYVTGETTSHFDFPSTPGAYDTTFNGSSDAFVVKLTPDGSGLVYSTLLGGIGKDDAYGIALDADGNAYVTGYTVSTSGFPTTGGAYDTTYNGGGDVFVAKLNTAGSALAYSTFVGGSGKDHAYGIAVDTAGAAYVAGYTESSDFPTPVGYDVTYNGGGDAFVFKLSPTGNTLGYSTFLGGPAKDIAYAIGVDGSGNAYVGGETLSATFPTTPGAYDLTLEGTSDGFIAKLGTNGTALGYSTFLGGSGSDSVRGLALDALGAVYVTGETWSSNFPTTVGAYDTSFNGGDTDAFVTKLDSNGGILLYSTFLGGTLRDSAYGVAIDIHAHTFVTGGTVSSDFPIIPGAFDPSHNGQNDAFVGMIQLPTIIFSANMNTASDSGISNIDRITNVTTPVYDIRITLPGDIYVDWDGDSVIDFSQGYAVGGIYSISPATPFVSGTYPVNVRFEFVGGTMGQSVPTVIDTSAPGAPNIPDLTAASDTGISNTDNITNVNKPVMDLTGITAGDYYRLFRNGGLISSSYATGARYTEPSALPDSTYNYVLYAVDAAGNVSGPSPTLSVTIDTVAPATPGMPDLDDASDTGVSNTDNLTYITTPLINLPGILLTDYFRLYRNGSLISGSWGSGVSYSDGPLADGSHAYVVNAVDVAGNVSSPSLTLSIRIDTVAPSVTSTVPTNGAFVATLPSYTVNFSEPIDTAGVATGDLVLTGDGVGDLVVDSVSILSNTSVRFNLTGVPAIGTVTLTLPAGATTDIAGNGTPLDARSIRTDPNAPMVVSSNPLDGAILNALPQYTVDFSTAINPDTVGIGDLVITGAGRGTLAVSSFTIVDPDTITFNLTGTVGNGIITLTIPDDAMQTSSGVPSIEDIRNMTGDVIRPTVVLTSPTNGALLNSLTQYVVDVSESINTSGVGLGSLVLGGAGRGSLAVGSFVIVDQDTVRFNLTGTAGNGAVTLTIPAGGVSDIAGNNILEDIRTVTLDTLAPSVAATTPRAGTLINSLSQYVVDFSEPINTTGVGLGDLVLSGPAVGSLVVTSFNIVDADTVRFNLIGLPGNGTITLTMPAGAVADLAGNPLTQDARNLTADTIAPYVSSTSPTSGSRINALPTYTVTFSEAIDTTGVGVGDLLVSGAGAGTLAVSSYTIVSSNTVRFDLSGSPTDGSVVLTVPAGAVNDVAGNPLTQYVGTLTADVTAPFVVSTVPTAGAIISSLSQYVVDFSEPIDPLSVQTTDLVISGAGSGGLGVTGITIVDQDTVTFLLSGALANGPLTLSLLAGAVTDLTGNPSLADSRTFTVDVNPPRVLSTTPATGSVVLGFPTYVVDFSKPINPASVQTTDLQLSGPGLGTLIVDSFLLLDADTIQFNLTGTLGTGRLNLDIPAGAVTDLIGNLVLADSRYVTAPERIPLLLGVKSTFVDLDGSTVSLLLSGQGVNSFYTLTNGGRTGAPIGAIVLNETSQKTSFSVTSSGGLIPGTTFETMDVTKSVAPTAGSAMGTLSAAPLSLVPNGQMNLDGGLKTLTLGDFGDGADVSILGSIGTGTFGGIGDGARLRLTGNLGAFKANSSGAGSGIHVGGGISSFTILKGNLGGAVTAGLGISKLTVSLGSLLGDILANGTAGIGTLSVPKGGLNGTVRAAAGGIKTLSVGLGNLIGTVESGGPTGIRTISIPKGLFAGTVRAAGGPLGKMTVGLGGLDGLVESTGPGGIGTVSIPAGQLTGAIRATAGGIKSVSAGLGILNGRVESNGTAGIGTVTVASGGLNGTVLATQGLLKTLTVKAGDLAGLIQSDGAAGVGAVSVSNGSVNGATIGASHAAGGVKTLTFKGPINTGTLINAGTAGVGTVSLTGNGDLTLRTTGTLKTFNVTGSSTSQRTLSGLFDVKVLSSLAGSYARLRGLTIRATDGITSINVRDIEDGSILSANTMGAVTISNNLTGSLVLGGYDVGADGIYGTGDDGVFGASPGKGNLGAITVNGSMTSTSIAANVAAGADGWFGTADDIVLSATLEGAIKSLFVKGVMIGSSNIMEHYGVVAHQSIGSVKSAGQTRPIGWEEQGISVKLVP